MSSKIVFCSSSYWSLVTPPFSSKVCHWSNCLVHSLRRPTRLLGEIVVQVGYTLACNPTQVFLLQAVHKIALSFSKHICDHVAKAMLRPLEWHRKLALTWWLVLQVIRVDLFPAWEWGYHKGVLGLEHICECDLSCFLGSWLGLFQHMYDTVVQALLT